MNFFQKIVNDLNKKELVSMKRFIEFEMDARKFGVDDAGNNDLVLVTIDTEQKNAWFVWYNPNNPAPMNIPANHPSEDMDFEEALELYREHKKGDLK